MSVGASFVGMLSVALSAQDPPSPAAFVTAIAPASRAATCRTGDGVTVTGGRVVAARPFDRMQGFARVAGTTGGLRRRFIPVWRADDGEGAGTLRAAVAVARREGGGWVGFAPSMPTGQEIALRAPLRMSANMTIDGGCVAPLITALPTASILYVQRVQNVVVLRLRLSHRGPRIDGKLGGDCITVSHGADRVWIAYNELSRCTDGLIDITQSGVDAPMRVTVAHNYLHDHDKAMLISGDHCQDTRTSCDAVPLTPRTPDRGVQATLQANVFLNTGQRHPRASGRAFVDVSDDIVAYRPQRRTDGTSGGSYGAFAANGSRLLIRNALYLAMAPAAAQRAVMAVEPASPGAVRLDGLVTLPATSTATAASPTLVAAPAYVLDPQPRFAADPATAIACIVAAAGTGGWDRLPAKACAVR